MKTARYLMATLAVCALLVAGCGDLKDAVEQSIQGDAAALKEGDMPNCSRVLNCCTKLKTYSLTPEDVITVCDDTLSPSADSLITSYQQARQGIENDGALTAETRAGLLDELKTTYQDSIEPGCRCFLDQTVGDVSADGFLSPADCEVVESVGALTPPATCEDAQDALVGFAQDPPTVGN